MDERRFGRMLRAIRTANGETQAIVAERASVSQSVYSRAERGRVGDLKLATLDRIATALDAHLVVDVRFQGGLGDRLIDRAHAAIVEIVVATLRTSGWQTHVEFSFNVYGERGSVDILGWHASTRTLLIVEVKSRFTDLQEMLLSLGRKLRLVPGGILPRARLGSGRGRACRGGTRDDREQERDRSSSVDLRGDATGPRTGDPTLDPIATWADRRCLAPVWRRAPGSRPLSGLLHGLRETTNPGLGARISRFAGRSVVWGPGETQISHPASPLVAIGLCEKSRAARGRALAGPRPSAAERAAEPDAEPAPISRS